MRMETIDRYSAPRMTMCKAARGDYFDGFVGDANYAEIMEPIEYDDEHYEFVKERAERIMEEAHIPKVKGWEEAWDIEEKAKSYSLMERLFRRGHWGPFEHPHFTLALEGVSRTAMAQITRHRHITFDVQSQRYVDFGTKDQPVKTPKSLVDEDHFTRETGIVDLEDEMDYLRSLYDDGVKNSVEIYEELVENGVPKEDARFILPEGTKVNLTMTMNARTVFHIQNMRNAADAQWEARQLAVQLFEEFEEFMPYAATLYEEYGPHSLSP